MSPEERKRLQETDRRAAKNISKILNRRKRRIIITVIVIITAMFVIKLLYTIKLQKIRQSIYDQLGYAERRYYISETNC